MGKKSRQKRQRQAARGSAPKRQTSGQNSWRKWLGAVGLLLLLAGALWGISRMSGPKPSSASPTTTSSEQTAVAATPDATPTPALPANIGGVRSCVHRPAFVSELNMGEQIYIGTNLKGYTGLTLSARDQNGELKVFQHPTWDDAHHLAAYVLDAEGNIFVAPAPFVSLDENPPEEQNNIYKIDTNTAVMSLYMKLPWAAPPNTQNPFGVMGLTYDCETNSLYASSVAGSTYDQEKGRIFQIDLSKDEIVNQLQGVDALGLGIHRGVTAKRLYFGSARNSSVRSVVLAEDGAIGEKQRLEFYLQQAPGGKDERAKRVQFPQKTKMLVKGIEFNYTLRAASDFVEHDYYYTYDLETDSWKFEKVELREQTF